MRTTIIIVYVGKAEREEAERERLGGGEAGRER
jgi:hypothetical protein